MMSFFSMAYTLPSTTIFMDGKVYAIEKNDVMKNGIKDLMKNSKSIYEGNLHRDGLYRVTVDPSKATATTKEGAEINMEKANLYVFPRIQTRTVAEGVRYLHLCLGHMSKHTMVQVAKRCMETPNDPPFLNWPKSLTAKTINENWIPCTHCIMGQKCPQWYYLLLLICNLAWWASTLIFNIYNKMRNKPKIINQLIL